MHDVFLAEGSVDGDKFEHFVMECMLLPFNGVFPRSVVIMDNATIRHVDPVVKLILNQAKAKINLSAPILTRFKGSLSQIFLARQI